MKLHVLAFAAHPDDIELGAGGTLIVLTRLGYRVGIVDMTRGEFGSRGDMATRMKECAAATRILGVAVRENLGLRDGHLVNDRETQLAVVRMIRQYKPDLVFTHHWDHPHPDHQATARAVTDAVYLAGLARVDTGTPRWRPRYVLYHQVPPHTLPTLVVDISDVWDQKMEAVKAYRSQFFDEPGLPQPRTYLSEPGFLERVEARHRFYGSLIKCRYGEGFVLRDMIPVRDLVQLLVPDATPDRA